MKNPTFVKALDCLSHPITLVSLGILFLNDHVLRVLWPSWVTGKLGDFAWLYFMPFVVAAGLAWLLPTALRRRERVVGRLSVGGVALLFALGNTLPGTHALLVAGLTRLLATPIRLTRDPTDLIALVSCGLAWLTWQRRTTSRARVRARALALLPAAALLTVANSAAPDLGITCLQPRQDDVLAFAEYQGFISADGGLTWQPYAGARVEPCDSVTTRTTDHSRIIADPDEPQVLYRLDAQKTFAYSGNGGETWTTVPSLDFSSQAELAYVMQQQSTLMDYARGPFNAVRAPQSDNLILAMGLEGVVVRTSAGQWQRVPVGEYGMTALAVTDVILLLSGELWLAVIWALLSFCALSLVHRRRWLELGILSVVVGGLWAFIALGLQPALNGGYGVMLQTMLLIAAGLVVIGETISIGVRSRGRVSLRTVLVTAGFAVGGAVLWMIPHALWAADVLPRYVTGLWAALTAGSMVFLIGVPVMLARERS